MLFIDQYVFVAAPFAAVSAKLGLNAAREGFGLVDAQVAYHHKFWTRPGFQPIAVVHHLFERNRWQQRLTVFALEIRHLRHHLHRHNRLFVGFAFIGRVHHLQVPGFGLFQLLFGWRVAEITLQQGIKQLRQTLGVTVGVEHQAVVSTG